MKHPRYILVVQHDPTGREETRGQLEQVGHHVTSAADGAAALALAAKAGRPYDAIVIDLALPGMSGLELAHRMGATRGGAGAPLLCIAPGELTGRRRSALERWFAACLSEPCSRGQLIETLAGVMGRAEARPRAV